MLLYEEEKL
ncbi:hypothetical protein Zm00014a_012912 [Zea mays]|uniref:Uncharacterized protein n=1 Tax=Zea mays TaxID=4577 RepID=A0A3L6ET02_MAIZE|nr:hypothetical protein Zm00014a_012912 [Zea mays]